MMVGNYKEDINGSGALIFISCEDVCHVNIYTFYTLHCVAVSGYMFLTIHHQLRQGALYCMCTQFFKFSMHIFRNLKKLVLIQWRKVGTIMIAVFRPSQNVYCIEHGEFFQIILVNNNFKSISLKLDCYVILIL